MPSEAGPLRVALVGCGGIARTWLDALEILPELQPSDIVEPDAARRRAGAERTGARVHTDLDGLIEDPPEAALVLTPPASHPQIAIRLLEAGIHVLCEKPLATSAHDARRMLAAAERAERRLMPSSKFRYVSALAEARVSLRSEAIGRVVLYENVFCSPVDMTGRWNGYREQAGGGVLMDNGSHAGDVARFLLGPVARVTAVLGPRIQEVEVEDNARVLFETRDGVPGLVDLSWSVTREDPWFVRVTGDRGCIEIGWRASRARIAGGNEWRPLGGAYDKTRAFAAQLADFARAIRGEPAGIAGVDGLAAVQFVEAAYRSVDERTWIEVDP